MNRRLEHLRGILALLIVFSMLLSFSACAQENDALEKQNKSTITVTDMVGRKVEIPADTKTNTVCSTYGVVTPFLSSLQISDRVLATNFKNKAFFRIASDSIVNVGSIGTTAALDAEALATMNPTIYICRISDDDKIEVAEKLGIAAVTFSAETPEEVIDGYKMLGKMFGCEKRAQSIIDYLQGELDEIDRLAASIKNEDRVTALCLGSQFGKVAGEDMLQTIMLKRVGARTVVDGIVGEEERYWADCGVEKVFELDPEYIFVTSSAVLDYKIDDFYVDNTWNGMKAVQEKNVFLIPSKMDSWDMPGPGFVLAMYYMMHCMYPDVVSAELLQKKIDNYYTFLYGKTFTGEEIGYSF